MTGPRVANISAGAPFVDSLAAGIWQMVGRDDPLALTRVTVLLPLLGLLWLAVWWANLEAIPL